MPPVIDHIPLANPQCSPAPFAIEAAITDNFKVARAVLQWSCDGAAFQETDMLGDDTSNVYRASIPAPGTNGQSFAYRLIAADIRGLTATNGPHAFLVDYPFLVIDSAVLETLLRPDTTSNRWVSVANEGSTNLHLTARLVPAGFADAMDGGPDGWRHGGTNDLWTLSTNRSVSGSNAWYCGRPAVPAYGNSMHAWLDSPPVYLGRDARLTFWHWIRSELDVQYGSGFWQPDHAWDGGIVELSTNSGLSFVQIDPVGGYPRRISGWSESPWPQDTPCFAGTGGWTKITFDLSAFATSTAVIRFHFGSDDNTVDEGWYIDDVVLTPDSRTNLSLSVEPATLEIVPGQRTNLLVTCSAAGIPTGDREALLEITGNAVNLATGTVPVAMMVRSPPVLAGLTATQTSTNGEGLVTVSSRVSDSDGDPCVLDLAWSPDDGSSWRPLSLLASLDTVGQSAVSWSNASQVAGIGTWNESGDPLTNQLSAVWNTSGSGSSITLAPAVTVRGRLWDGRFWSDWVGSPSFMVDNEPPEAPGQLAVTSHELASWSTNPVIHVRWQKSKDGAGAGLADYQYRFISHPSTLAVTGQTTACTADSAVLPDGSNIWASVRARDVCGNVSTASASGPYWIDAAPPSPAGATVTPSLSPFGPYLVGSTTVTGTWAAFTDTGAGIEGYYYAWHNGGGTTNGRWAIQPSGVLTNARVGETNTLFVWARDRVGHIGLAASASFLVLDPEGNLDGDALSNADEEMAGTDASNPASILRLAVAAVPAVSNGSALQWVGVTNRVYTLLYRQDLTDGKDWVSVPGLTRMAGQQGTMTIPDPMTNLPVRFYRISVETP